MTTLKIRIKIPLMMLFAIFALSACTGTGFQKENDYSSFECKRLHSLSLISLDEERKCRMGQEFKFKKDQPQNEAKTAMPCCAEMKDAQGKTPMCAHKTNNK